MVPITEQDRDELYFIRKTNEATVGRLKMRKDRYVKRSKEISDKAELAAFKATKELAAGEREMECSVRLDFYDGQARCYRIDTGELVYSRPLTSEERQAPMPFEEPYQGASASAKAKQPGLGKDVGAATTAAIHNFRDHIEKMAGRGVKVSFGAGNAPSEVAPETAEEPEEETVLPELTDAERVELGVEIGTTSAHMIAHAEKIIRGGEGRAIAIASARQHMRILGEEAAFEAAKAARKTKGKGKKSKDAPPPDGDLAARARAIADELQPIIGQHLAALLCFDVRNGKDADELSDRAIGAAAARDGLDAAVLDELGGGDWDGSYLNDLDEALYGGEPIEEALVTVRLIKKRNEDNAAAAKERERLEAERDAGTAPAQEVATPTFPLDAEEGDEPEGEDDFGPASEPVDRAASASAAFTAALPPKASPKPRVKRAGGGKS